jgi:hypothetical protein
MIKVSLAQDSMLQMALSAMAITSVQVQTMKKRFMNLARATESEAKTMAAMRLNRTSQQYRDAISFNKISETESELKLDASASHLELGYPSYDMKPGMLNSTAIVQVGKRAGKPWVRRSEKGYRWAVVPFEQSTKAANPGHPLHGAPVQIGQATQTTMGDLASDLKKLVGMARGQSGGRYTNQGDLWAFISDTGRIKEKEIPGGINPLLEGLTKSSAQVGKKNVSQYNTFRVVSENPTAKGKWKHPGYAGCHIFRDLESWMRGQMEIIVRQTLGGQ